MEYSPILRITWADTMARGIGHFLRDNREWDTYYSWMVQNADAIWKNRRTDHDITWNGWDEPTPTDDNLKSTKFASAVAWLQFTPATKPSDIAGSHTIVNKQSNRGVSVGAAAANGDGALLSELNNGQSQKWIFMQNSDNSWSIISQSSWKALDCPGGAKTNALQMVQWQTSRDTNQRWLVEVQPDGSYKISNQQSGLSLERSADGSQLIQSPWSGRAQQLWQLK